MVLPRFVKQALAGEKFTIHGDGTQSRCFANVRDVVKCLDRLSQPGFEGQIFNVGSTEEVSIKHLAYLVSQAVEPRAIEQRHIFDFIPARSTDMARRVPCVEKLRGAIGYVPSTSLADTIRDMVEAMR
jgi:UDP-glucose 4-epimerase